MSSIPPALILILGALVLAILPHHRLKAGAFLMFTAVSFWWLLQLTPGQNMTLKFLTYTLMPLRVDQLSLFFSYAFVIMTFVVGIYSFHIKDTSQQVFALLYAGSSLGVIFAGDLFTLVVFWEIMAVSSVFLILARRTDKSNAAAFRYIIVHIFGGSVLIAGVLLHITQSGSIMFNHLDAGLASNLIVFGFCLNAAIPPIHAWLSDAYPEGTVTGSVFLSIFTTKTAVYALIRGFAGWEILIWVGTITALYGVVYAILQNDTRRLLSYHIISQVGYMVAGIGLGTALALNGAAALAITNILYKSLLFMAAGAVLSSTGRSKLTDLGNLARAMPCVLALYMIGAFSISGFPLFAGFVSKSMVISAAGDAHLSVIVLLLNLAAVGTLLSVGLKLPYYAWFGNKKMQESYPQRKHIPTGMYISMTIVAILCVLIGVYPDVLYNLLPFHPNEYHPYTAGHIIESLQLLIFTGLGFWLLVKVLQPKPAEYLDFDWFYRRPSQVAYGIFVAPVSKFFGKVESWATIIVHFLVKVGTNPTKHISFLITASDINEDSSKATMQVDYDPDRSRLPVEPMLMIVLLLFVIIITVGLFRLLI